MGSWLDIFQDMSPKKLGGLISSGFGLYIRKLRQKQGLSVSDLSDRTGILRNFITLLEEGRTNCSLDYAVRIAHTLGITIDQIICEILEEV